MHAVLLDATPSGAEACRQGADALRRALSDAGYAVEQLTLRELPVAPCRGCFACWTDTPGRCPFSDASQSAAGMVANADVAVVYSPVRFGAWSFEAKKFLDRMICLVSPRFDASGLTRHKARYPRFPAFLGVGWLPGPDQEAAGVFARLVTQNAYNLRSRASGVLVLHGDEPWAAQRASCLAALGRLTGGDA